VSRGVAMARVTVTRVMRIVVNAMRKENENIHVVTCRASVLFRVIIQS
jgi:hypothetical protein